MARTARAARTVRTVRCARPARRIPIAFPVRIAGALRTARTVLTIGHTRTAHPIRIVSTYRTARTFGVTNGAALGTASPPRSVPMLTYVLQPRSDLKTCLSRLCAALRIVMA